MPLRLEYELLQAARDQDVPAVQRLLENGADPNAGLFGQFGNDTPISIAVDTGNEQILDLLLEHQPLCCMVEEHAINRQPRPRKRRFLVVRTLAYNIAATVATRYCLRRFATLAVGSSLGPVAFWTSHYHWYIVRSFSSDPESLAALRDRYRNPWKCADILLDVLVGHKLYVWIDRRFLTFAPVPWTAPGLFHDLLVALPLRFCLDALFLIGRGILTASQILKSPRRMWIGDDPCLRRPEHWSSPVERVTRSIIMSDTVTENMVLKLLQMDMLALRPYAESPVAAQLLQAAIHRCWVEVTTFLLSNGTFVDQNSSEKFEKSRLWPMAASAVQYCLPQMDRNYLPTSYLETRYVNWPYRTSASSIIELVTSPKFRNMAVSQFRADHIVCMTMLEVLVDHGADPLLTDFNECDALSHVANLNCPTEILQHMAFFWKEERSRLLSIGDAMEQHSQSLHQVTNIHLPNLEKIQVLLNAGVSPLWEDLHGRTPLFNAAYMNRTTDAMDMLFKSGMDPDSGGSGGYPPIVRTLDDASLEKFEFFLDNGADPDAVDKKGVSVLQLAVQHHTLAVIKAQAISYLLERGAIVYDRTRNVAPAFIAAAQQSISEGWDELLLNQLLSKIPLIHRQRQLDIALKAAICSPPATFFGNLFTIFHLLLLGSNPNLIEGDATALLQLVCSTCKPEDHDHTDGLRYLLAHHHPDLNLHDSGEKCPVHHCINNGSRDFLLILLENSANPAVLDNDGHTVLQLLCSSVVSKYNITKCYDEIEAKTQEPRYAGVRGNADWKHKRRRILRDIKHSLGQEEMFQALVDHSTDLTVLDSRGCSLLMLASEKGNPILTANILYYSGKEYFSQAIRAVDINGQTSIHFAAASGDLDTLKILLWPQNIMQATPNAWRQMAVSGEANFQAKNNKTKEERLQERLEEQLNDYANLLATTPSFLVSDTVVMRDWEVEFTIGDKKRRQEEKISLPNVSTSTWTLQKSESIRLDGATWCDTVGRTPLHYAAEQGHLDAVRLLLDYTNIDLTLEDCNGKKAVDLALEQKFYNVYSIINTSAEV